MDNVIEKLEWALMTIQEQLKFGLAEEDAIKMRERQVRGVLKDVIKELKNKQDIPHIKNKHRINCLCKDCNDSRY